MPRYTEQQIEKALRRMKGMKYLAAQDLGCSYHTIADRLDKSEHLQRVVAEETGKLVDLGELKLFQKVQEGDPNMIKYLLSNKGKDRGYGEKLDITSGGEPLAPFAVIIHEVADRGDDG